MDRIFIDGLRVDAEIGVFAHEHGRTQPLRFDVELGFDNRVPAASDTLADTFDYAAVSARLAEHARSRHWNLVETLAESCAALLMQEFGVRRLQLRITKPEAVPAARGVGVIIERGDG